MFDKSLPRTYAILMSTILLIIAFALYGAVLFAASVLASCLMLGTRLSESPRPDDIEKS